MGKLLFLTIFLLELTCKLSQASNPVAVEENVRRLFVGEDPLMPGLRCTAHNLVMEVLGIPVTPPEPSSSFVYRGEFNARNITSQEGLSIIPEPFRERYASWFMLRCIGLFISETSEQFLFTVTSDDGIRLTIDRHIVIDEWTQNLPHVSSSGLPLSRGIHTIEISYFQSTGNQTIVIEDQYGVIEETRFFH